MPCNEDGEVSAESPVCGGNPCGMSKYAAAIAAACQKAVLEGQKAAFKQSTPERRLCMLIEDGPQGILATLYTLTAKSLQWTIVVLNIGVPALRLIFAYFIYPILLTQEAVLTWLSSEWSLHWRAGNRDRADIVFNHLADAGDAGGKVIAEVMRSIDVFEGGSLNLQDKDFSDAALKALARMVGGFGPLQKIDLTGTEISDSGVRAWADALTANTSVQELHLWETGITDDGGRALAEALAKGASLRKLNLRRTKIGDAVARAFAEALLANSHHWRTCGLINHTNIGEAGKAALQVAKAQRSAPLELAL